MNNGVDKAHITILGCGSSGGVPRSDGDWGACDPNEPLNQRMRCSLLVQVPSDEGMMVILVDSSPDFRMQMLANKVGHIDHVFFTHDHADQTHGIDDLRVFFLNQKKEIPIYGLASTIESLKTRFAYCFQSSPYYPPILKENIINSPIVFETNKGQLVIEPIIVKHGAIEALGFVFCYEALGKDISKIAYIPDVSFITQSERAKLYDLNVFIIDALRYSYHPTHANLKTSMQWVNEIKPKKTILTNLHVTMDYQTLSYSLPSNIRPAFDQMRVYF